MFDTPGFSKLPNRIKDFDWLSKPAKHSYIIVLCYILLNANIKEKSFNGSIIKKGELITSTESIAKATGLTNQKVRTALKKLKTYKFITKESTSHYSKITIVDSTCYNNEKNSSNQRSNQRLTNVQPTSNQRLTTTEECKNIRNKERKNNPPISPLGDYDEEFKNLWSFYPKRLGTNSKQKAYRCYKARLKEGHTVEELFASTVAYQGFCRESGKLGSEYVMGASVFYGRDKHFLTNWEEQSNAAKQQRAKPSPPKPGSAADRSNRVAKQKADFYRKLEAGELPNFGK